jgi:hypothetical protein
VEQVDAERDVGDDVDDRHRHPAQAGVEVAVHLAVFEAVERPAERQVGEVPQHEQHDDRARPPHRPAGEAGDLVVASRLVLHRAGAPVEDRQRVGGMDVGEHGEDQAEPHRPQHVAVWRERHEQLTQALGIDVDVVGLGAFVLDRPEIDLEVADHVGDDESDQGDTGDRHDVLLADGGGVEVDQERLAFAARPCRGARHRPPLQRL